jgi:hypothetical protein
VRETRALKLKSLEIRFLYFPLPLRETYASATLASSPPKSEFRHPTSEILLPTSYFLLPASVKEIKKGTAGFGITKTIVHLISLLVTLKKPGL